MLKYESMTAITNYAMLTCGTTPEQFQFMDKAKPRKNFINPAIIEYLFTQKIKAESPATGNSLLTTLVRLQALQNHFLHMLSHSPLAMIESPLAWLDEGRFVDIVSSNNIANNILMFVISVSGFRFDLVRLASWAIGHQNHDEIGV